MNSRPYIPVATYRLQLNHEFTFADATAVIPYLSSLGISHCYISPCLKARTGSMHGYDIVDHNCLNPEIGSMEDFDRFVAALHGHNMGLILDIVPNHMGVLGGDNAWWMDVLENGQSSIYASFFDIDWEPPNDDLEGKVLVPALHDHYGSVLESGELKLVFEPDWGAFTLCYRNHRFPVNPRGYPRILQRSTADLVAHLGEHDPGVLEFQSLITAFGHLPDRHSTENERIAERNRDKEIHKRRLAELCSRIPEITAAIERQVRAMNGDPANPSSFEDLHELIKTQAYRLANWRVAADDINYRRFFDTNDLAGICQENEQVFDATHRLVLRLIGEGKVDGLRIDHPDGLYDPAQYFQRLRDHMPPGPVDASCSTPYLIIEKVLTGRERLRPGWPVCGTTGYEFATLVNGLFVDHTAAHRMESIYEQFIGDEVNVEDLAYFSRKLIIRFALASELNVLANRLTRIALSRRRTCDFTLNSLRAALAEVAACFPVYRTYVSETGVSDEDRRYIDEAVEAARRRSQTADISILDFVRGVLLTTVAEGQNPSYRASVTSFAMKFQQFTSPVMAKGLEDTAFYRYHRLVSLNEVGSDPQGFGTTRAEFHRVNQETARDWPHTMLATGTHDSKRSEDVRARINLLSEIPGEWRTRVRTWKQLNRKFRTTVEDQAAPSANDEYLLYQTLIGAWPLEPFHEAGQREAFRKRIDEYMRKALREAKHRTSWINQNAAYESAVSAFIRSILGCEGENNFLKDFVPFQRRLSRMAQWNSLSQTLLKLTCPGLPDIYQGNEMWDFSLVDPDNRRPVDFALRRRSLDAVCRQAHNLPELVRGLLQSADDGRAKLYLIWKALCQRRRQPYLFSKGEYRPVATSGSHSANLVAFARTYRDHSAIVVVPRLVAGLLKGRDLVPIGPGVWEDTSLLLSEFHGSRHYKNAFTGESVPLQQPALAGRILEQFPVALLVAGESEP
jgi:(1->4)-alpha-D-glucan 1-alpha-D-glucosylmutase